MIKRIFLFFGLAVLLLGWALPVFAQVDTVWVRRYNGPGGSNDKVKDMVIDQWGNIYVAGYTIGVSSDMDYTTIKYYPNGDTAWIRFHNGSGNNQDEVRGVALDSEGNIYITGTTFGATSLLDHTTIKYYSNGSTAWIKDYDGPGNYFDAAYGITVDDSGCVYVTGYGCQINTPPYNADIATIKYDSDGDTVWVRNYDGPANSGDDGQVIKLDGIGNIFIAGKTRDSLGKIDCVTIKYNSDGDTVWTRIYNGTGNYNDIPIDLAVDSLGYAYVAASSQGVDLNEDYVVLKYDPNGNTDWIKRYNGPGNSFDVPTDIALDDSGYIYVTGISNDSFTSSDFATIKYHPNGDTVWLRRFDGSGSSDGASALALDDSGNVYVTGYSDFPGTQSDYATVKYDKNGVKQWSAFYAGPDNSIDEAMAVGLDSAGHIIISGTSRNDFLTIMYTESAFIYGDANYDGEITVSDVIYIINYLFKGGPPPVPELASGDANCNGEVTVSDVIYIINYLFKGGPAPGC